MKRRKYVLLLFYLAIGNASSVAIAEPTVRWQEEKLVAEAPGKFGPWRMNESEWAYVDSPAVALSDTGEAAVAWVDQARKDVFFQRFTADAEPLLPEPVNVSRSSGIFSWLPRVVLDRQNPNEVYLLWQEIVFSGGSHGGEIFFARSTDAGRTFAAPLNLSQSPAGDGKGRLTRDHWSNGSLDLVQTSKQTLIAAWTNYEGELLVCRSKDGGISFSEPRQVGGSKRLPARAPDLAVGEDGRVVLAWTPGELEDADIHLAISHDDGATFTRPRVAIETAGHSDAPRLAIDSSGDLHLVFGERPEGMFRESAIAYARMPAGENEFGVLNRISNPEGYASGAFPALSVPGSDLFVLWSLYPSSQTRPRALGYTVSATSGREFAPSQVISATVRNKAPGGRLQGMLANPLDLNREGGVAVVYSTFLRGQRSAIWLYRGQVQW